MVGESRGSARAAVITHFASLRRVVAGWKVGAAPLRLQPLRRCGAADQPDLRPFLPGEICLFDSLLIPPIIRGNFITSFNEAHLFFEDMSR